MQKIYRVESASDSVQLFGSRFFNSNIRYGLGEGEAVNRGLTKALRQFTGHAGICFSESEIVRENHLHSIFGLGLMPKEAAQRRAVEVLSAGIGVKSNNSFLWRHFGNEAAEKIS